MRILLIALLVSALPAAAEDNAVERGLNKAGGAIERGVQATGRAAERGGHAVQKAGAKVQKKTDEAVSPKKK